MAKHPKLSEKTRERIVNSIPNFYLLSPDDQIRETVKLIAGDFLLFCERNLMIRDKYSNQLIPFYDVLNWEQMELIKMVAEDLATGRPIRYIVLKARQMGMSTLIEAMGYWWTSTHRFTTTVIIAHEKEATKNLYEMFRRYYEYSHPSFKPDRKYNTKQDLTFDVSDEVKKTYDAQNLPSPGLQSEIKTMVATEGKGRSSTIKFLHGSEVAFWDDSADVTSAAVQAVPMAPETFIFLESTANGIGGYYYDEWNAAKRGESQFRPVFFPWHSHNEYETPNIIDDDLGDLDAEEEALYKLFEHEGYDRASWPRKIYWRRLKKKEFRTDPKKFYQEYPSTPEEAFLASGRPVFDVPMLQEMERIAVDAQKTHPYMCGDIKKVVDPETGMERIKFIEIRRVGDNDPTPLRVWWDVDRSRKYVIGVDVSEGIEVEASSGKEADFSVITVFDVLARKVVARWRGYADPDQLGEIVFNIGTYYNTALVGVEINNHGIATAAKLRNMFYRNLYMRETAEDEQFQVRTTKFGWQTNKKTKPIMISELQRSIREGDIIDLDIVFIREAMSYIRKDNGAMEAQQGQHDDVVMSTAIALQMADWSPYNTEYAAKYIQKPVKRYRNATTRTTKTGQKYQGASGVAKAIERRRRSRAVHRGR
nr:MAG TPA: Terminase large subunit [Caudoviricetes sp.]